MTVKIKHEEQEQGRHLPSIWAFVLIALGVIWLLFEAHVLSGANLVVLFRLWPVVLIAFGLELLVGRSSRSVSLLIGLGTIVLLIALMLAGPALGLAPNAEIKTFQQAVALEGATSAQINLDLSVGTATVQALEDSTNLISADLRYVGDVNFSSSGSNGKDFVTLSAKNDSVQWFNFLGLSLGGDNGNDLYWNIGLSPKVPLDVRVRGGVGDGTLNLNRLQLTRLNYNGGVGDTTVSLPGSGTYSLDFNGGVGKLAVNFADGANVDATVDAGVGEITLDVPDDAPVYLESDGGLGDVHVPANFNRISGDNDNGLSRDGVWETANYSAASDGAQITIHFKGGVGSLTIR